MKPQDFLLAVLLSPTVAFASPPADAPLTEEKVCDYLETRVQTNHLQLHFRDNASRYDDVPVAFFKARDAYLRDTGWTVEEYEDVEHRIGNARYGMEKLEKLEEDEIELEEDIAEMKEKGRFDQPLSQRIIKAKRLMIEKGYEQVEGSRPDWPAVRPHVDRFEHLTDWVAFNVPNPPLGCDGEEIALPPLPAPPAG
ncbi:MAG: hypothetical protein R3270_10165 [Gammaproteobacteria bacterium]|nr:hypothetical protein [Gammaproteobacteria bacterium]